MKHYKDKLIIGVDHGYGNIKTANTVMPSGVMEYDSKPDVGSDILFYDGKYYIVGEGHKELFPIFAKKVLTKFSARRSSTDAPLENFEAF